MVLDNPLEQEGPTAATTSTTDLLEHIDDWLEYLSELCKQTTDVGTRRKYERKR